MSTEQVARLVALLLAAVGVGCLLLIFSGGDAVVSVLAVTAALTLAVAATELS